MNIAAFTDLLDTHGGDPSRWPEPDRAAALAFAGQSPEAADALEAAQRLDRLLSAGLAEQASANLRFRIGAAAHPARRPAAPAAGRLQAFLDRWRLGVATAAAAASIALGMVVGLQTSVASVLDDAPQESIDLAALALEVNGLEDIQ